jgi:hypothetical protein
VTYCRGRDLGPCDLGGLGSINIQEARACVLVNLGWELLRAGGHAEPGLVEGRYT